MRLFFMPARRLAATLLLVTPGAFAAAPSQSLPAHREGEVLVTYATPSAVMRGDLRARLGLTRQRSLLRERIELLRLPAMTTTAAVLPLLRRDPAVLRAEPNFVRYPRTLCPAPNPDSLHCPNDTLFSDQWGLHNRGQPNFASPAPPSVGDADMDLPEAWDPDKDGVFDRVGDGSVTIAIVDDSVTTSHPDLAANIVAGFDFLNGDSNPNPDGGSDQQHGTLVAGAAGAIGNNGIGVAGTAWNVKLMPLKFGFDVASHIDALEFARDNGADIVNASFGGPGFAQAEVDAIQDLADNDILYVAAAGNDDSNTDVAQLNFPANFDVANIVSVAATNRQDNISSFSQYGAITTDVAAPGLQIVTTENGGTWRGPPGVAGTSFSAPYVAGIAALIRMEHPTASYAEVKARLIEGADPGDEVRLRTAGGRVNAARSLDMAPQPSLVISAVDWTDANEALDPGETTSVDITLHNLWIGATNVSGTLSADANVTVTSGAVDFGDIGSDGTATGTFTMNVAGSIADHHYVHFTLTLTADGGYSTTRGFIAEIGRLTDGVTAAQAFAARDDDLYDEFHAWHYTLGALPAGHSQLVIETTSEAPGVSGDPDIDLLAKKGAPPRYSITVGINPETDNGFFCTSATTSNCQDPDVKLSASASGDEQVVFDNPTPGTFHVVVVNFAQLNGGLNYTIRAYTRVRPAGSGVVGGGSGGGAPPASVLAVLLAAALLRRRARLR